MSYKLLDKLLDKLLPELWLQLRDELDDQLRGQLRINDTKTLRLMDPLGDQLWEDFNT